jgi:hypothetical protein
VRQFLEGRTEPDPCGMDERHVTATDVAADSIAAEIREPKCARD